jgi:hypothetical protein
MGNRSVILFFIKETKMPRKTRYLNVDQKLYNDIIGDMKSFFKLHKAKWDKSQDILTTYEGDKELVNLGSVAITAEVTLDEYAKWAEFYNMVAYGFCSLAACKLPNHYFNTNTTYGHNEGFRTSITNMNVNIGFVTTDGIKYTYRVKINFDKGN